jgi:hypothetical protein
MKIASTFFKITLLFGLLASFKASGQQTTPYLYDNNYANWCATGVPADAYRGSLGIPSHRFTFQSATTTNEYFKINNESDNMDGCDFNQPGGSTVWSGGLTMNTIGTIYLYGDGNGGAGSYPVAASKTYSLIWQDVTASDALGVVMETSNTPVTITSSNYGPVNPAPGSNITVTVNLSGVPSEDQVYVRYTTNAFATYGTLLPPATGAGTATQTFTIPAQPNNTVVTYYIFTSTLPFASLNGNSTNTDIGTLFYDNNGGVNYSFTVLPIELMSFSAVPKDKTVELIWSTATEHNNAYFDIERSLNGHDWNSIGQVKGHGNSTIEQNYQWTDQNTAPGLTYYRLKQVDTDGGYSYSPVVEVSMHSTSGATFVSPNPVQGDVLLISQSGVESIHSVAIFDLAGQLLKAWSPDVQPNELLKLDLDGIPSGILLLRVNEQAPMKIVKY